MVNTIPEQHPLSSKVSGGVFAGRDTLAGLLLVGPTHSRNAGEPSKALVAVDSLPW
jgi:hypothetical protein